MWQAILAALQGMKMLGDRNKASMTSASKINTAGERIFR